MTSAFSIYQKLTQSPHPSSIPSFDSSLEGGLTESVKSLIKSAGTDDSTDLETSSQAKSAGSKKRKRILDERTPLQKKVETNLKKKYLKETADELSPILAGHPSMMTAPRQTKGKSEVDGLKVGRSEAKKRKPVRMQKTKAEGENADDSSVDGRKVLAWLINPVKTRKFFQDIWEQKPLLVKRHKPNFYKNVFSGKELDRILEEEDVEFGTNVDIALYKDGQRFTLNPDGRAHPSIVWKFYRDGCSIRLLNPQTYCDPVWQICSRLQEFFGSFVGGNVYLTPPGSQGFAPHYDDIEAFVMQIEGKKRWRVYSPRSDSETLPRHSSPNFLQQDIGDPILEVVLEPGDLLYFPRGYIHQAETVSKHHSLHITLSTYQLTSWADLLEKLLPAAVQTAAEENAEFREGLPLGCMSYMGLVHSDKKSAKRAKFISKLNSLVAKLSTYAPVDAAVDQMSVNFTHSCLPPHLSADERLRTVHGVGPRWSEMGLDDVAGEISGSTKVRMLRRSIARLAVESEQLRLYYCVDNSRVYQEKSPQFMELTEEEAVAFEYLANAYPTYVEIKSLPMEDPGEKIEFSRTLFNRGILSTETPLDVDYV